MFYKLQKYLLFIIIIYYLLLYLLFIKITECFALSFGFLSLYIKIIFKLFM
jgi:hypothetical protein